MAGKMQARAAASILDFFSSLLICSLLQSGFTQLSNGAEKEGGNHAPPLSGAFQSEAQL